MDAIPRTINFNGIEVGRCEDEIVFPQVLELTQLEQEISDRMIRVAAKSLLKYGKYTIYKPFRGSYPVTQSFNGSHRGVDWGLPNDTDLCPMFQNSLITFTGYTPDGYAWNIRGVDESQGLMFLLAHMPETNAFKAQVGQYVNWSEVIGWSDNTGNSTGPHVHAEIRVPPYSYYANAISYYTELDDLPSDPPPGYVTPEFPELPVYEVLAEDGLNVRIKAGTGYKKVALLKKGTKVEGMGGTWVGGDFWVRIGLDQHIAALYQGQVLAELKGG